MSTITLEIPEKIEDKSIFLSKQNMDIYDFFNMFWIDFDYLLDEQKYSNDFLNDIKENNFIVDNKF